ncbi:unnamed protein product [Ambrosiozyma monospora]|uniref:Unnamed protein product n=1 Tax=Ambrosiozyma monospora TaxID=43982 RepID=A0A9W7DC19_AMBMO|nr:unnamed protein product [Ambrosiozyma monospora]
MTDNEFTQIPLRSNKKKSSKSKSKSKLSRQQSSKSESTSLLLEKFETKLESIKSSKLFDSIIQQLDQFNNDGTTNTTHHIDDDINSNNNSTVKTNVQNDITTKQNRKWNRIRCLAIGSISTEFQALYQLCLLKLLVDHFKIPNCDVSLYDPVFNNLDLVFLKDVLGYSVDAEYLVDEKQEKNDANDRDGDELGVLYFMPHSPISLIESIFDSDMPQFLLVNDLVVYDNKFTKFEYFQKFPNCARVTNLISVGSSANSTTAKTAETGPTSNGTIPSHSTSTQTETPSQNISNDNEFQVVTKKKKKNKKNRKAFKEPVVEYHYDQAYFDDIVYHCFELGNDDSKPWGNSFSDFCLIALSKK